MNEESTTIDQDVTVSQATVTPGPLARTIPDWEAIKASYLQGESANVIAAQHGVTPGQIRTRAWRYRWRDESQDQAEPQAVDAKTLIEQWLVNMSASILASSQWWSNLSLTPETMRDARDLEAARSAHIASGRALFNLDKPDATSRLSWAGTPVGPVIDVVTTTRDDKPSLDGPAR